MKGKMAKEKAMAVWKVLNARDGIADRLDDMSLELGGLLRDLDLSIDEDYPIIGIDHMINGLKRCVVATAESILANSIPEDMIMTE